MVITRGARGRLCYSVPEGCVCVCVLAVKVNCLCEKGSCSSCPRVTTLQASSC